MATMRWSPAWTSWPLLLALACGGESVATTDATTGEVDTDADTDTGEDEPTPVFVDWDDAALELILRRGEDVLLRFPGDALQLGEVDAVSDALSYDPVFSEPDAWRSVIGASAGDDASAVVDRTLEYEGGARARLRVFESAPGRFRVTLTPDSGDGLAYFRLRPITAADEGYYGLGEYFDSPEHRGRVRALQLEADGALESGYNEAHVPVPFLTGTRGWGLYVASDHPAVFDVAAAAQDRVAATFGTGPASGDGLEFHLFAADHPLDVTRHYYEVTGYPRKPAPWALGPWIWRDENDDQAQVEADLAMIRALDLATSAIWIDRPYASAVNTFDFEPARFPSPQAMIDLARAQGFQVALWHSPYVDADDPAAAELRAVAEDAGYFPPKTALLTSSWDEPVDFTNPDAYAWWKGQVEKYTAMGIAGFKLDYGEDVTVGFAGARTPWEFADGSSERTMHKGYARRYHEVYAETLPEGGGFLLCRAGAAGDQVNASVIWPGDLDANMARHGEKVNDDGDLYTAVGGLPAAVVAGLSLGPSGFPLFASDTGGYRHSPPDRETFTRWFEYTALTPVMQIGTSTNDVAWEFTADNGFDDETLAWYREYTRLHLRLFPYAWTLIERLAGDGRPILRPLGLAFPELGAHPPDTYMFGDALLVAPVIDHGARARDVHFPPGRWIDWFTLEVIDAGEGGLVRSVDAPLEKLPLYLAEGQLVPLLRPTVDTLAPTDAPDTVDSYAVDPGVLYARALLSADGAAATLFDGAALQLEVVEGGIVVTTTEGAVFRHGVQLELLDFGAPPSAVLEGAAALPEVADPEALEDQAAGWAHASGALHLKVGAGSRTITIAR